MRVSDDILYIEKNDSSYGKENEPHITVLYGIKNNSDYFKIQQMLKSFGPIKIKIGEISKFEADDYDVIKMSIESKKLHILHNLLKNKIDNDFSYPDYNPHMTLAYVRKGSCDGLLGPCEWTGYEYEFNNMQFSHKDGYKLHISFH